MVIAAGSSTTRRKLAISPQCRGRNRAVATFWARLGYGGADTGIGPGRGAAGPGTGCGADCGTACSAAAACAARRRRRAAAPGAAEAGPTGPP